MQAVEISKLLKNVKFFVDREIQKDEDLYDIALTMSIQNYEEEEKVFDYGDQGDKFYIILKGQVGVDIPIKVTVSPEEKEKRKKELAVLKEQLQFIRTRLKVLEKEKLLMDE